MTGSPTGASDASLPAETPRPTSTAPLGGIGVPPAGLAAVTIPVAVYLLTLWFLQVRPNAPGRMSTALHLIAAVLVLAATFVPRPVVATAVIVGALVATMVWLHARTARTARAARAT